MSRPILLDLFCGAGGASMGYHRAGFEVVGVDINPQLHYPFEFIQADATTFPLEGFAAIHASPPCQAYSTAVTSRSSKWVPTLGKDEPALIPAIRERLIASGVPYVIENVMGARAELRNAVMLCATMFGLPIPRHRLFETSWPIVLTPGHPDCRGVAKSYAVRRGWDHRDMTVTGKGRRAGTLARWQEIMGIGWYMSQHQMAEAIPPAYTEWIGRQLLNELTSVKPSRVRCEDCGDWACARHGVHIGEKCNCWPCDDCGDLFPQSDLDDYSVCVTCRGVSA